MYQVNGNKLGLFFGGFLGLVHLLWSLFVALDWAQPLINFSFRMHMVEPFVTVGNFDVVTALELVVLASLIGYVLGRVLALIWNKVHAN